MSSARPLVVIIGAGGLARALAHALARSGKARVAIASRRPAAAAAVARGARGIEPVSQIENAAAEGSIVVLAVPDRAIASVAKALTRSRRSWRGTVVLHAAGAYGPELLAPLRARGAATGVCHPLAVLGAKGELAGAAARIEGDAAARTAAKRICRWVGLIPLAGAGLASPRGRSAYHAAASLASNDVVALLAAAQQLLVRRGVPVRSARRALAVLAEGALRQVRDAGVPGALTGPVARNDAATLLAQLRVLGREDKLAAEAHRALSARLIEVALQAGLLDKAGAIALGRRLRRGPVRSATV